VRTLRVVCSLIRKGVPQAGHWARRVRKGHLVFHHVLLELFEELLGFREG